MFLKSDLILCVKNTSLSAADYTQYQKALGIDLHLKNILD